MLKNKIVYKLTAGYVIIVLIALLAVGVFVINVFRSNTIQNKQKSMLNMARQISEVTMSYIIKDNNEDTYGNFMNIMESFINSRVWVLDTEGNVLSKSKSALHGDKYISRLVDDSGSVFDAENIDNVLKGNEVIREGYSSYYKETMLAVGVPIYDEELNVRGAVLLYSSFLGISKTIDEAFTFLVIGIILTLILISILSFYFSILITKPIKAINASAVEMTKGNYSIRTNVYQQDEIGQLSKSFNLLAAKLGYTIDQLFQEKTKLNDLVSSISEGILAFDYNMNLLNYNGALKNVLEYGRDTDVEKMIIKDLIEREVMDEFKSVLNTGEGKSIAVEWNIKKLKFILSPVKNNHGAIIGVVSLIQDISESERLEQMRKDFIANVSHELRTPLTLIRGSIESLIDGAIIREDDVQRYYTRILNETAGLERLVGDLLDLSRLQSGKIRLNIENVDVISLLMDVSCTMQPVADLKKIIISTEFGQNVPMIVGDYDRLRQLFIIFIDNAIKYSHDNSALCISVCAKEYVYIKIKDNGLGISKEDIPFVWERFYKADKARSLYEAGTGLGLPIAKYLINLHKGVVRLESEINQGTIIEIGLPFSNRIQ